MTLWRTIGEPDGSNDFTPLINAAPIESGERVPCMGCGHEYDKVALPVVELIGGEYEQKWFCGVRGGVRIVPFFCPLCGYVTGVGIGEHKGAVIFSWVARARDAGDPELWADYD